MLARRVVLKDGDYRSALVCISSISNARDELLDGWLLCSGIEIQEASSSEYPEIDRLGPSRSVIRMRSPALTSKPRPVGSRPDQVRSTFITSDIDHLRLGKLAYTSIFAENARGSEPKKSCSVGLRSHIAAMPASRSSAYPLDWTSYMDQFAGIWMEIQEGADKGDEQHP